MVLNKKLVVVGFALVSICLSAALSFQSRASLTSSKHKQQDNFSNYPIADAASPEPIDPNQLIKRRAKSEKYKQYKRNIGPGVVRAIEIYHWPPRFPELPVLQSDAVVVGKVTAAAAYLTEDKTGVYSEFTFCVEEVIKASRTPLATGAFVTLDRAGGRVRFPSGKISQFSLDGFGMPRVGHRYLLFLKGDAEQDFQIITGYELLNGRVFPLDRSTSSDTNFDIFKNSEEGFVLNKVRNLKQTSSGQ